MSQKKNNFLGKLNFFLEGKAKRAFFQTQFLGSRKKNYDNEPLDRNLEGKYFWQNTS